MKTAATIAIVAAVVLGAWFYVSGDRNVPEPEAGERNPYETAGENGKQPDRSAGAETSLGMYAEENALVPADQKPGAYVSINRMLLKQAGYAVVHEDAGGKPGAILGASLYHDAGEHSGVRVKLTRASRDGETLHVMIHAETNGDMNFDSKVDKPVESALGGPIVANFKIDAKATPVEVMP